MIDEFNDDNRGWARFSYDRRFRYRLGRVLTPGRTWQTIRGHSTASGFITRVVFVMLNPSTADAFKLDPTVSKCCQFAMRWGADVLEVVNLFALRSPHPKSLDVDGDIGDDEANDASIFAACEGASHVVAAWGNNGWRRGRDKIIRERLRARGIQMLHLGLTGEQRPLHPLARGKAFIPLTREPQPWVHS